MTNRTWLFTFITTLLIFGLAACGGSGGGGGGGGASAGMPTASNAEITPPPTAALSITTSGGVASTTNQRIGVSGFNASDAALVSASNATNASEIATSQASSTQAGSETLAAIVRRHAERLKDHQGAATSAVQINTQACSSGGTRTFAFDDANLSATEVYVNCNEGGTIKHGTISSSNVGVSQDLGSTPGSPYTVTVAATFTIDLSTTTGLKKVVNQASFTFTVAFRGNMEAAANGGVQPGVPNRVQISISGTSFLAQSGTIRSRLSNFSLSVDEDDTLGRTTISGGYTYASTLIGGLITVTVSQLQPIVYQPQGAARPSSGAVTITSSGSPGKILVTVISSPVVGVRVDVFANAADALPTDTANLTWAQVDAL